MQILVYHQTGGFLKQFDFSAGSQPTWTTLQEKLEEWEISVRSGAVRHHRNLHVMITDHGVRRDYIMIVGDYDSEEIVRPFKSAG